jgi:hypothetical protein
MRRLDTGYRLPLNGCIAYEKEQSAYTTVSLVKFAALIIVTSSCRN